MSSNFGAFANTWICRPEKTQLMSGGLCSKAYSSLDSTVFDGEFVACQWPLGSDIFETCFDLTDRADTEKVFFVDKNPSADRVSVKKANSFRPAPGLPPPPGLAPRQFMSEEVAHSWDSDTAGTGSFSTTTFPSPTRLLMSDYPVAPECPPLPKFVMMGQDGFEPSSPTASDREDPFFPWADQVHEEGTCKPCLYFRYGGCQKKSACTFCHLDHDKTFLRKVRPSKRTRACIDRRTRKKAAAAGSSSSQEAA